jgi:hypothetical protein
MHLNLCRIAIALYQNLLFCIDFSDPDNKAFLPATDMLAVFPLFHASAENNFVDVMLPKQSCILFTMHAVMLLISLNKMPIFESTCNNTFLDISHQSSNGPVKYSV